MLYSKTPLEYEIIHNMMIVYVHSDWRIISFQQFIKWQYKFSQFIKMKNYLYANLPLLHVYSQMVIYSSCRCWVWIHFISFCCFCQSVSKRPLIYSQFINVSTTFGLNSPLFSKLLNVISWSELIFWIALFWFLDFRPMPSFPLQQYRSRKKQNMTWCHIAFTLLLLLQLFIPVPHNQSIRIQGFSKKISKFEA